ncbi:MAG: FtsX-like permease family protein [Gemmatimonadetes bacterium]|nr:FtsX-like permease family protein [Gemmatimonadota bacterium]
MGAQAQRTRELLIVSQVALAATLLVVAALLVRTFNELVRVPPGFRADDVVTFTASANADYATPEDISRYHRQLIDRLDDIPGVTGVGMVSDLMFTTENMWTTFDLPDRAPDPTNPPRAEFHVVLPSYFDVLEIPLLSGVMPEDRAYPDEIPVLINARMAEEFWPDGDAIGSPFSLDWSDPVRLRVAGIVGDVLDDGYDSVAEPAFFVPFGGMPRRRMSYVLRVAGDPTPVFASIRSAVAGINPDIPAADLQLLENMLAESVARPRAASLIGMTFALIALLVSASGIYGVLSYAVQTRTREIGIRAALGATTRQVISMVMGHSTRLVGAGLVIGILGALAAGRALSGLLFGVRSWDPVSLLAAVLVLGAVGSLAAWLPARRAVRIDPTRALRMD